MFYVIKFENVKTMCAKITITSGNMPGITFRNASGKSGPVEYSYVPAVVAITTVSSYRKPLT